MTNVVGDVRECRSRRLECHPIPSHPNKIESSLYTNCISLAFWLKGHNIDLSLPDCSVLSCPISSVKSLTII